MYEGEDFNARHVFKMNDYARFGYRTSSSFATTIHMLVELGLAIVDSTTPQEISARLSTNGWNSVRELLRTRVDGNRAFVAMWFAKDVQDIYDLGIEPALKTTGYVPIQIGRTQFNGKIDDAIVAELRRSSIVVADFTGHRGGVYWEAGFAAGRAVPVIFTCRKDHFADLHFDVRQFNTIVWETYQQLRDELVARVRATGLSLERDYKPS